MPTVIRKCLQEDSQPQLTGRVHANKRRCYLARGWNWPIHSELHWWTDDDSPWQQNSNDNLQLKKLPSIEDHRRQRRRGCRGRDPRIFDLQGSSCVDDPPIFWQVFYFFPSEELLNTASRSHFHLQCSVQFLIQQLNDLRTTFEQPSNDNLLTCNFRFLTINSFWNNSVVCLPRDAMHPRY